MSVRLEGPSSTLRRAPARLCTRHEVPNGSMLACTSTHKQPCKQWPGGRRDSLTFAQWPAGDALLAVARGPH